MEDERPVEPPFGDARASALLGFWLALGVAVTGALWWNLAGGPPRYWHPGIWGVIVTPVAVVVLLYFGWRLWRARLG